MFRQGPVPLLVHGVVDYLVGVVLVAMPFVLHFSDDTARMAAVGLGVVVLVLAATSDLPTGLVHSVPRALHALFDYVLAVAIIAAPFVLGFSGDDNATLCFVAVGIAQLLQTIGTRFLREKQAPRPRVVS